MVQKAQETQESAREGAKDSTAKGPRGRGSGKRAGRNKGSSNKPDHVSGMHITYATEYLVKKSGLSENTILRRIIGWNCFVKFIERPDLLVESPAKSDINFAEDIIENSDIERMAAFHREKVCSAKSLKGQIAGLKHLLALCLGANQGLRVGEYKFLKFSDISTGKISIIAGKHGHSRDVVLDCNAKKVLSDLISLMKQLHGNAFKINDSVFGDTSTNTFNRWLKAAARAVGVDETRAKTHGLRHRFARNHREEHNKLDILAKILGHSSIETTRIYTIPTLKQCGEMMTACSVVKVGDTPVVPKAA
jgi:integrase